LLNVNRLAANHNLGPHSRAMLWPYHMHSVDN